ncbi:MAG: type I-C CRISPR-associated protein Cas8c/Csd1 [Planctomycetes bacterium]|nr:type I-C CRISPR-associated protein Cas8c/Csd1 [Planctomycetota bacterium]
MLLRALYDLACSRSLFEAVHLQERTVHLLIPVDSQGALLGNALIPMFTKDGRGKDRLGRPMVLPRFPGENNGGKAFFLADSCTAILGIDKQTGEGLTVEGARTRNAGKSFLHFWKRIADALAVTGMADLKALTEFMTRYIRTDGGVVHCQVPFLEIRPNKRGVSEVGARTGDESWERLEKATLTFQVDGRPVFDGRHDDNPLSRYWADTFRKEAFVAEDVVEDAGRPSRRGLCMVTGRADVAIARSHKPKVLRVPGLASGGYIVSFAKECPSFSSFGFEMGENAPMSEEAAASYALALQSLLDSESTSVRLGQSVLCFWAREEPQAGDFFARMLNRPDPASVANFLGNPWSGLDRDLAKRDAFYSVTLAGNAGRVVIRHWMEQTVDSAREHFHDWFRDLDIQTIRSSGSAEGKKRTKKTDKEGMPPLALFRLACATVRDAKDIQTDVAGQLYRAALEGTAPSLSLLQPILAEFQSALVGDSKDKPRYPYNESRFALLRLIVNRNRNKEDPMIEPTVCETADAAYNCGRLLEIFDELQERSFDYKLEGPGVVERYYGTASSAPNSAFGILWRLHQHHLRKLSRSGEEGRRAAKAIESRIAGIARLFRQPAPNLPPEFPRTFTLVEQGRFALGFYQEKAASAARREEARKAKAAKEQVKEQQNGRSNP